MRSPTGPHILSEAERLARAAEARWVRSEDGAIRDDGALAQKLCEAWLLLADQDHDPHWRAVAQRALRYVHDNCRDPNGWYAKRWDDGNVASIDPVSLISQASAARAYFMAAHQPQ